MYKSIKLILGLFSDDLLITETDRIQEALRRLPRREFYDRIFRIRRAISLTTNQEELPKTQWTTPENVLFLSSSM